MKSAEKFIQRTRSKLTHKCNLAMLDLLARYPRKQVAEFEGKQFLDFGEESGGLLLPLPRRSAKPRFDCADEMVEFYDAFDGLRESDPGCCGHFVSCREVCPLWQLSSYVVKDEPKASLRVIFVALNGDLMTMNSQGAFQWHRLHDGSFSRYAPDFAAFLTKYIRFRSKQDGFPFDSFGRC